MKKFLTFLGLILIAGLSFGQTTIFNENCSSTSAGWTMTGTQNSGYYLMSNTTVYVKSASYDLSSYVNLTITSNLRSYGSGSVNPICKIEYSTDGGTNWSTTSKTHSNIPNNYTNYTWSIGVINSTTVVFRWKRNNSSGKKLRINNLKLEGTSVYDDESIIEKKSGWSEPTNIAYGTYNAASNLTTANSIEVAKFTIKDGGSDGTDTDTKSTKLTNITFSCDYSDNLKALAIFDGNSNVKETTTFNSAEAVFNSLSLEATDEGTKDFTLRATFATTVTDNANQKFTISSATADNTGSSFAVSDAGGAATDGTGNNNKLIVTADRLAFATNRPPSSVETDSDFGVEVDATDANGSVDKDASNSITLAKASGTGILSSTTGLTQSLTNGTYYWTDVQYNTEENFTIEVQAASLINKTSGTISCITISNPAVDSLYISEVSEGPNSNTEYLELYNPSNSPIDLSNVSIVRMSSSNVELTKALTDFTGDLIIKPKGYWVISRGSTRAQFESDWPSFPSSSKFMQGNNNLYFAAGTARRWRIIYDNSAKADVIIDDSQNTIGGSGKTSNQTTPGNWTTTSYSGNSTPGARNTDSKLPIEIISFTANNTDNIITINWQTASEKNNNFFTIERSYNANDFESIGEIQAAGNSNQITKYSFIDNSSNLSAIIYYRLKQTDFDGKYTYSSSISVNSKTNEISGLKSYVTNNNLNISLNSTINQNANIELLDITGRVLFSKQLNINKGFYKYQFTIPNHSSGIYFIRLISNDSGVIYKNQKLIIR